jgi:hypothetical protein
MTIAWSLKSTALLVGTVTSLSLPASAQAPTPTPTTAVLVSLTIKPDADRAQLMKVLPDEVRATVKLYLDGKIRQWYSRSDGRGVLFIMNSTTVEEAKGLMDDMPLSKASLNNLEFTALGPLSPLRLLMAPATNGPGRQ